MYYLFLILNLRMHSLMSLKCPQYSWSLQPSQGQSGPKNQVFLMLSFKAQSFLKITPLLASVRSALLVNLIISGENSRLGVPHPITAKLTFNPSFTF